MKNFVALCVFISAAVFGLAVSDSPEMSGKIENYLHRDCARWADETFDKPLFTLREANHLLGKKVFSRNKNFRNNETGRIISIEMVAPDEFLMEVYWGNGAEDENSTVTFHDKENFSRDFRVLD